MLKSKWWFLVLILFVSCKSITIDSVTHKGNTIGSTDSFYISSIEIKADDRLDIEESFCRMMVFSLNKRGFRTALFIDDAARKENYRYHILLHIFVNTTGDVLDTEISNSVFLRIIDNKSSSTVATIRSSCNGCELQSVDDQKELCEKIAEQLDQMIKG